MPNLYQRLATKKIKFLHVCEVGVSEPETSNILGFINDNVQTTLVEADSALTQPIRDYFRGRPITLYPVAIWDHPGVIKLARAQASTFVVELKTSPALTNDNYELDPANTFEIECVVFSSIDDQTIDLLSIDIEGSEWYVLKHMLSHPKVISIETHGKYYVNPFLKEITAWMDAHEYSIWYKDNTDSVYIQQGLFELTWLDRLQLAYKNFRLDFRRRKGAFLKRFRG